MDILFLLPSLGHLASLSARFFLKSCKLDFEVTILIWFSSCCSAHLDFMGLRHLEILTCWCSPRFCPVPTALFLLIIALGFSGLFAWIQTYILTDGARVCVSSAGLAVAGGTHSSSCLWTSPCGCPPVPHTRCAPDWADCSPCHNRSLPLFLCSGCQWLAPCPLGDPDQTPRSHP